MAGAAPPLKATFPSAAKTDMSICAQVMDGSTLETTDVVQRVGFPAGTV